LFFLKKVYNKRGTGKEKNRVSDAKKISHCKINFAEEYFLFFEIFWNLPKIYILAKDAL
jgi:hypothetical protein